MEETKIYTLDLHLPQTDKQNIEIKDSLTIGSDSSADFVIENQGLSPIHLSFRHQSDILSLTMLGKESSTQIGPQKLVHGKMYLLSPKDTITVGDLKIIVAEKPNSSKVKPEKESKELVLEEELEGELILDVEEDSENQNAGEEESKPEEGKGSAQDAPLEINESEGAQDAPLEINESEGAQDAPLEINESEGAQDAPLEINESEGAQDAPLEINESEGAQDAPLEINESEGAQDAPLEINESEGAQDAPLEINESEGAQDAPLEINESEGTQDAPLEINESEGAQEIQFETQESEAEIQFETKEGSGKDREKFVMDITGEGAEIEQSHPLRLSELAKKGQKTRNPIKKLIYKLKRSKRARALAKKEKKSQQRRFLLKSTIPGALVRLMGLAIEFFLAVQIGTLGIHFMKWNNEVHKLAQTTYLKTLDSIYQILPHLETFQMYLVNQGVLSQPFELLKDSLPPPPPWFTHAFVFMISFISIRILSNLVFTMPLPLFLLGVKNQTVFSPLKSRAQALVRELIGFITFPFLIFDIPALFQKRTFKEVLTSSLLCYSGWFSRLGGLLLLNPLIVIIALFFLLDLNLRKITNLMSPFPSQDQNQRDQTLGKRETSFKGSSFYWNFRFNAFLDSHWHLIPFPQKQKKGWNLGLFVVDDQRQTKVFLHKGKSVGHRQNLKDFLWLDPILPLHSPHLAKWNSRKSSWTLEHSREWSGLIKACAQLSPLNLPHFVTTRGFFFYPYTQLKKEILKLWEEDSFGEIKTFRLKKHEGFLIEKKELTKVLTPVSSGLIRWDLKREEESQEMALHLTKKLFLFAQDIPPRRRKSLPSSSWNALNAMDALSIILKSRSLSSQDLSRFMNFTLRLSYSALKANQIFLQKQLIQTFKQYDHFLLSLSKRKKSSSLKNLRLSLNRTQKALQEKDLSYFKANLP